MRAILIIPFLVASLLAEEPAKTEAKQALKENPNDPGALYNLGLACYLSDEYTEAIQAWERLEKLEPGDWQLQAKLIQAYWAAGKEKDAAKRIEALRKARAAGSDTDLSEQKFFIRDQFVVGKVRVFTLEYFELEGDHALLWKFLPRDGDNKVLDRHFSLGSYAMTNELMHANGKVGPNERGFHLDSYHTNGTHQTFGFYSGQPDYGVVRKQVTQILENKLESISSTTTGENREDDATDKQPAAPEKK